MARAKGGGESVAGYFRKVFTDHPKLLWERSNAELFKRWLDDHPGQTEVPGRVKQNLQNIKSVLRAKGRKKKRGRPPKAAGAAANSAAKVSPPEPVTDSPLEGLEVAIDECMVMARGIDVKKLHKVIGHLRLARNSVVWMQGQ